jgi:two-component system phosphate regulon sensor histidine kinase PhoR
VRQELGLFAGLAVAAVVGGRIFGYTGFWLVAAAVIYTGWHVANLARLVTWLKRPRLKIPVSFGVWEWAFDRLQAINLRNRRRKRDLFGIVRRLRLVIGGLADAVVLLDDRGRVRWFNPAAKRLLGLKRPAASKKTLVELFGHLPQIERLGAVRERGTVDMPSPVNGAIMLRMELSELPGTGQHLLVARDVTRTHNLERLRKDFVANVSHELRTPLTVFRGYLETLADETENMPALARPVALLNQQAVRMQSLVEDLLYLSRVEFTERASHTTQVAVPDIVDAIIEEARQLEDFDGHEMTATIDRQLWLLGNTAIIQMVFANLIFNAVKHSGAGAHIRVEWLRDEDEAVFRVTDDGRGIASDHLTRLTERFYRVDAARSRASGGTGLGLAIAKHGLERHGADLQIASIYGKGSSFTCRFPAERVSTAPRRGATEGIKAAKRETIAIS